MYQEMANKSFQDHVASHLGKAREDSAKKLNPTERKETTL